MNTSTIITILGTTVLGLMRKNSGSLNSYTPENIESIFKLSKKKKLGITFLDLSAMGLESLPNNIFDNFDNLEILWLTENNLTSLPKEIGNLVNLESLDLEDNKLTCIPKEIGNLINLRTLHLNYNNLTSLPKEIGNLINLKELQLNENNLTSLPKEIGNLVNLESLELNENNLTSLPKEIGNLFNLVWLDLDNNKLQNLHMPDRKTLQYWMRNLKSGVFREIMESIRPSSQLRIF